METRHDHVGWGWVSGWAAERRARERDREVGGGFHGPGGHQVRAFLHQDMVVCLLENGATKAEVNLVAAAELVRLQRDALQRAMESKLVEAVERLTAQVRTF